MDTTGQRAEEGASYLSQSPQSDPHDRLQSGQFFFQIATAGGGQLSNGIGAMLLTQTVVIYQLEPELEAAEFIDVLVRSTLAERRPVDRPEVIAAMLRHADVVVTARMGGQLVGVSRAISDFSYCTYLSDLAVDEAHQGHGIGRELIRRTHEAAGLDTTLILLAAPGARSYYPHIGMHPHESCWIIPRR